MNIFNDYYNYLGLTKLLLSDERGSDYPIHIREYFDSMNYSKTPVFNNKKEEATILPILKKVENDTNIYRILFNMPINAQHKFIMTLFKYDWNTPYDEERLDITQILDYSRYNKKYIGNFGNVLANPFSSRLYSNWSKGWKQYVAKNKKISTEYFAKYQNRSVVIDIDIENCYPSLGELAGNLDNELLKVEPWKSLEDKYDLKNRFKDIKDSAMEFINTKINESNINDFEKLTKKRMSQIDLFNQEDNGYSGNILKFMNEKNGSLSIKGIPQGSGVAHAIANICIELLVVNLLEDIDKNLEEALNHKIEDIKLIRYADDIKIYIAFDEGVTETDSKWLKASILGLLNIQEKDYIDNKYWKGISFGNDKTDILFFNEENKEKIKDGVISNYHIEGSEWSDEFFNFDHESNIALSVSKIRSLMPKNKSHYNGQSITSFINFKKLKRFANNINKYLFMNNCPLDVFVSIYNTDQLNMNYKTELKKIIDSKTFKVSDDDFNFISNLCFYSFKINRNKHYYLSLMVKNSIINKSFDELNVFMNDNISKITTLDPNFIFDLYESILIIEREEKHIDFTALMHSLSSILNNSCNKSPLINDLVKGKKEKNINSLIVTDRKMRKKGCIKSIIKLSKMAIESIYNKDSQHHIIRYNFVREMIEMNMIKVGNGFNKNYKTGLTLFDLKKHIKSSIMPIDPTDAYSGVTICEFLIGKICDSDLGTADFLETIIEIKKQTDLISATNTIMDSDDVKSYNMLKNYVGDKRYATLLFIARLEVKSLWVNGSHALKHYTLHNIVHTDCMVSNLEMLDLVIGITDMSSKTKFELVMGIYYHDLGMLDTCADNIKKDIGANNRENDIEKLFSDYADNTRNNHGKFFTDKGNSSYWERVFSYGDLYLKMFHDDVKDEEEIKTYRHHLMNARKIASAHGEALFKEPNIPSDQSLSEFTIERMLETCYSDKGVENYISYVENNFNTDIFDEYFKAIIMIRVSDTLDIAQKRVVPSNLKIGSDFITEHSLTSWTRHSFIDSLNIVVGDEISVDSRKNNESDITNEEYEGLYKRNETIFEIVVLKHNELPLNQIENKLNLRNKLKFTIIDLNIAEYYRLNYLNDNKQNVVDKIIKNGGMYKLKLVESKDFIVHDVLYKGKKTIILDEFLSNK